MVLRVQEYKSKIEQRCICRRCKAAFVSVDGSPCPKCPPVKKGSFKRDTGKKKEETKKDDVNVPDGDS